MVAMFFAGLRQQGPGGDAHEEHRGKIDADVDAQKTNIAQGWRGLERSEASSSSASPRCRTSARPTRATKASYWEGIALTARAHASRRRATEEKVNAEKLALAAQFKADKYKNAIQTGAEQKFAAIQAARQTPRLPAANELKKQNGEDRKALLAIAVKDIEVNGGKLAFSPDGAPGIIRDGVFVPAQGTAAGSGGAATATIFGAANAKGESPVAGNLKAKSKEDAQKLDAMGQNYAKAMKLLADAENHMNNVGTTINPWGTAAAQSDEIQTETFKALKGFAAATGGSPGSSEHDAEIMMKSIPQPGALFDGAQREKLKLLKEQLTNEYENAKKAMLVPADQPANPLSLGKPQ
jgi:hypothetical protein